MQDIRNQEFVWIVQQAWDHVLWTRLVSRTPLAWTVVTFRELVRVSGSGLSARLPYKKNADGFLSFITMEEWRQCARWLIDCKVLPPNHRVVWPSAVVFDLAQALRDGVLLCQMLHNLSPGSVDLKQINFRPQMSQVGINHQRRGLKMGINELFKPFSAE